MSLTEQLQDEYDEHCPWSYTEFGTICSCGRAVNYEEECSIQITINELIKDLNDEGFRR